MKTKERKVKQDWEDFALEKVIHCGKDAEGSFMTFYVKDLLDFISQQREEAVREERERLRKEINKKRQPFILESGHVHEGIFGVDLNEIFLKEGGRE